MNWRAAVAVVLLLSSCRAGFAADPPRISIRQLKTILHDQDFSGALDKDSSFRNLGVFDCGSKKYRIFFFDWAETRPDGSPGHGQQRIIFIGDGEKYIGSYWIVGSPFKVTRGTILVSIDGSDRYEIRCVDGELPTDQDFGK